MSRPPRPSRPFEENRKVPSLCRYGNTSLPAVLILSPRFCGLLHPPLSFSQTYRSIPPKPPDISDEKYNLSPSLLSIGWAQLYLSSLYANGVASFQVPFSSTAWNIFSLMASSLRVRALLLSMLFRVMY